MKEIKHPISYRLLFLAQNGRCFYCDGEMQPKSFVEPNHIHLRACRRGWTIDHLYPKCETHSGVNNIVFAHHGCNTKKGRRQPTPEEVARYETLVVYYNEMKEGGI